MKIQQVAQKRDEFRSPHSTELLTWFLAACGKILSFGQPEVRDAISSGALKVQFGPGQQAKATDKAKQKQFATCWPTSTWPPKDRPLTLCRPNEPAAINGQKHCDPKKLVKLESNFNCSRQVFGQMHVAAGQDGNVNAHVAANVVGLAEKHLC